ncbi:hypothetical protein OSCT_2909 [Oscillochloris trichoides DG-6]|uniref:Uncharacterized protein n=1 Tax=Oscillochloris trichoides DG-6 TaxID=765420 RepID=E1IHX1_9CHLR|nr:hypothetical protein [Oscillochloris trichoides]EFO79246.1 hypothetical protein OSCT_2909 [Oscillochloris trichoides DG-6]
MSHRSLFWPLSLITIVGITFLLLLITANNQFQTDHVAAATLCPSDPNDPFYPYCLQTQTAEAPTATFDLSRIINGCPTLGPNNIPPYPPYQQCILTQTALIQQTTQRGTVTPSTPTSTLPKATGTVTTTPTWTATPTGTSSSGNNSVTQPVNTTIPANTVAPTASPTITPTPTPEGPPTLSCIPGETITIEGTTNPHTALIVTFAERPVGGGFSRADGYYRIALRIGNERPGRYPVVVEDRATRKEVQELVCQVPNPNATPTPTPNR